ncbi:MAG TPA: type II toxin-antitoxin system HicA family toxin [Ignavibacteriaceae bacterium]|jgi:predicted RNA binding protein YcfA (HicA-like mRNA interferase family)|nr:type II toxin-antitoxin system HicA family toxin [Ignavibacteriaceae bacterium]
MAKLPVLSGKELIKVLERDGFKIVRQKGSHISLSKGTFRTVVPLHNDLSKGTLLGILKQSGITKEKLVELLK